MAKRRRSKFAIDFNQDKKIVAKLVLADLLRKHPRGANGKLGKYDYGWDRTPTYVEKRAADREGVGIWCGYTEDQIVELFITEGAPLQGRSRLRNAIEVHWAREQYSDYAEKSDEEIQNSYNYVPCATMTRRMDRIENRIRAVSRAIRERGRPGIFQITTGYRTAFSDVPFYVWANNKSEAKGQFETLTKPLIAAADPRFTMEDDVRIEQGPDLMDQPQDTLLSHSQNTINEMESLEVRLENQIKALTSQLEGLQGIKDMITSMAVQSITMGNI